MRKIPFLLAIVISLFVAVPTATQAETINTIPIDGYETTTTLPTCPDVYYDGVNPPVWAIPDGLPPTYDCSNPIPPVDETFICYQGYRVANPPPDFEGTVYIEPCPSIIGTPIVVVRPAPAVEVQYSPAFTG